STGCSRRARSPPTISPPRPPPLATWRDGFVRSIWPRISKPVLSSTRTRSPATGSSAVTATVPRRRTTTRCDDPASQLERRQVDPASLAVAPVTGFGELDALRAFDERRRERGPLGDMAQEQFPPG